MERRPKLAREFLLLYVGYVFSSVSDQLWSFAMIFILEKLGSIRLVCVSQLFESVSAIFLSAYIGEWMDRHNRLHAIRTVLAVNNISVALSALSLTVCMLVDYQYKWVYTPCLIVSIIISALSKCASEGEKLLFTKDWIIVLAAREQGNTLSNKNSTMAVIGHLSSSVTAIVSAYIIVYVGYIAATLIFVAFNILSWSVEYFVLTRLYNEVSELHVRQESKVSLRVNDKPDESLLDKQKSTEDSNSCYCIQMAKTYWKQGSRPAALCLMLAYMTVLGFDGIPISYGRANGMSEDILGLFKSASSVISILGALLYTVLERRLGVRVTGLIGVIIHQLLNLVCVLSIYLPGSMFDLQGYVAEFDFQKWRSGFLDTFSVDPPNLMSNITAAKSRGSKEVLATGNSRQSMTSILVFFGGITFARLGVWIMDLSVMQIMQESIPERERMTVFGIENSLCQFLSVFKDLIVIMISDMRVFGILVWGSVTFVFAGFLQYVWYFIKTRRPPREH